MILDFIRDNLNGDSWEKWCDGCYRDRFQNQNFIKVPAEYMGDAGIEGFTLSGIAYQCYCPEKDYSNDELYEHLRNKVTRDIGKLIDKDNAKRLKDLGVQIIKEWHFVTPEYKDKRIIEHLEQKRKEVVAAADADPQTFSYIDPQIRLVPKIAEDFKVELVRLIRNPLVDIKLNMAVKSVSNLDWTMCPAEKIDNIKRKIKAIMNVEEDDDAYKEMLAFWAEAYLKGIEIMSKLQESYGTIYEELFELEQQYKWDVSMRSRMNPDHSLNYKIFMEILQEFEDTIRKQFECFVLNIKDAKKRVLEYLLGLDTLTNEKKRAQLKTREIDIIHRWDILVNEIFALCTREDCRIQGLPMRPCILEDDLPQKLFITTISSDTSIDEELIKLDIRRKELEYRTPKVVDNFEELQTELEKTETAICELEREQEKSRQTLLQEKAACSRLESNLQTINADLRNNKDAQKLKRMGSDLDIESYSGRCPICGQKLEDSLLPIQNCEHVMSIEENIRHLEAQRTMVSFAIDAHQKNVEAYEANLQSLSGRIFTLRRLAKTIRSDLFSVDESWSETIVYERINIENKIQSLGNLREKINMRINELQALSSDWGKYLAEKKELPKNNFTKNDKEKVEALEKNFKKYLRAFNYQSVSSYDNIQISRENYLPISEGFDMKFDSSASDNIRAIWAYTLALLRTSNEKGGNHPQIVVFDEPGQHSIVTEDMVSLFHAIMEMPSNNQVILGITLNDGEIRGAVEKIDQEKIHIIDVGDHAFQAIN